MEVATLQANAISQVGSKNNQMPGSRIFFFFLSFASLQFQFVPATSFHHFALRFCAKNCRWFRKGTALQKKKGKGAKLQPSLVVEKNL